MSAPAAFLPLPWRRHWPALSLALLAVLGLVWGALAPLGGGSRELVFEVPPAAHAQRARGEPLRLLPPALRLTLGVRDVLVLRNRDTVPFVFGPLAVAPGASARWPFDQAGAYRIACPLQESGQLLLEVEPAPDPGWTRLRWRLAGAMHALRYLPLQGPGRAAAGAGAPA